MFSICLAIPPNFILTRLRNHLGMFIYESLKMLRCSDLAIASVILCLQLVVIFCENQVVPLLEHNITYNNPFVGLYVFPHGGVTLDPRNIDYSHEPSFGPASKKKAIKLNVAMHRAAKDLIRSKPDLIILSTPHGFHLQDKMLILDSGSASGDAGEGTWSNFSVDFNIEKALSAILYSELNDENHPVEILTFGNGHLDAPLYWGEVIPLHFIQKAAQKANTELPPLIYLGQPPNVEIQYQLNIGRSLARIAILHPQFNSQRIAVVISGDLSHYHGKPPNASDTKTNYTPYHFDPIGKRFDNFIVKWAKIDRITVNDDESVKSSNLLLKNAASIQGLAGHCAYNGLIMLHGILDQLVNQKWSFEHKLYAYDIPTYFGMIICRWLEKV